MAIIDFFDRGRLLNPGGTAFLMDDRNWTFDQAHAITCQVAHGLRSIGVPLQAKAAVIAYNHPMAWMCVLGLWRAGLTWVPMNPRSTPDESQQNLNAFDVEVLFFQGAFADAVLRCKAVCPRLKHLVCIDAHVPGCDYLPQLLADLPSDDPGAVLGLDDVVAIMPTGGTTGTPKGVMLSHRNLSLSVANGVINTPYGPGEPIVNLAAAPMTHSAGFMSLSASARGGTVVVLPNPDPASLLQVIEQQHVTELFLPPTVIYRLLEMPGLKERDLSSLRFLMYGAAPMSLEKLKQALRVFGAVMLQAMDRPRRPDRLPSCGPVITSSTDRSRLTVVSRPAACRPSPTRWPSWTKPARRCLRGRPARFACAATSS